MAITIRASGQASHGANTNSLTIDLSTEGIVEDDTLICFCVADEQGTVPDFTVTGMTGMSEDIDQNPTSGRDRVISMFSKKMGSSETDPTFNISISQEHSFTWYAITGLADTYLDVSIVTNSGTNDPSPQNSAITPTTANGMLLLFGTVTHNDITAIVKPTDFDSLTMTLGENLTGNHRNQFSCYNLDYGSAAAKTPTTWGNTYSNVRGEWFVATIALRPSNDVILDADSGSFVVTGTAATLGINPAFIMTAGSATEGNTTSRLTGLTGTHGGKLGESVAELPTVDLASDGSREDVWSISATNDAGDSSTYEFRVLYEGAEAQTVSVTPEVTIGSTTTTLDADSGSFVITGTDADTNITTPADSGSFVITGTAATTELGYQLDADSGSFVITGTAADLERSLLLAADSGSFVITGTAASLERSLILDADSGSFVITGTAADLQRSLQLAADSGSFVITGTAAELLYSEVLEADSGSFVITGTEASLELGFVLNADSGSFVITGTDATPQLDYVLDADSGSFVITGTDASLELTGVTTLAADSGSFLITGTAADLLTSPVLDADSGSFLITGTDATMELGGAPTVDEQFSGGWEHREKKKKKKVFVDYGTLGEKKPELTEETEEVTLSKSEEKELKRLVLLEAERLRKENEQAFLLLM